MIRNRIELSNVYINATDDKGVHDAVVALAKRKTACYFAMDGCSIAYPVKVFSPDNGLVGYRTIEDAKRHNPTRKEMSISELAALPDYQPTKRMTVPEICEALGYDVEIVKGGE